MTLDELLAIERELRDGPGDAYRRHHTDAAVVIVPGAVLTYRRRSRRGDVTYAAVMSTVYVRRDGAWRVVLHQQTPER